MRMCVQAAFFTLRIQRVLKSIKCASTDHFIFITQVEHLYEELSWSNEKFIAMLERLRVSGAAADMAADGRYACTHIHTHIGLHTHKYTHACAHMHIGSHKQTHRRPVLLSHEKVPPPPYPLDIMIFYLHA